MSAWWSLPKAVPILLRHLSAYADLAGQDLQRFSSRAIAKLIAFAIALLGMLLTLLMVCVAVIAAAWDTPHRLTAIFWLLGLFAVLTLVSLFVALNGARGAPAMFAGVKEEWSRDRVILDRLLAGKDQSAPPQPEQRERS